MKKYFAAIMVVAGLLAVSCGKDDNGKQGSTKTDEGTIDTSLPVSLQGQKYFPIILDETSAEAIKSRIVTSLGPNGTTQHLWVWDATYTAAVAEGLNFYGNTTGYQAFKVTNVGWSGAGWCVYTSYEDKEAGVTYAADPNPFKLLADNIGAAPADWTFHLAYKGKANVAHIVGVDYAGGSYKFAIGQGSLADKDVTYNAITPKSGEFEAGEWMEYEIPVKDMGLNFSSNAYENGTNIFFCLSGGTSGNEIALDAVFFYKK